MNEIYEMSKALTVGDIRHIIKDMPDDAPVFPDWADTPPGDTEPGVEIVGVKDGKRKERDGRLGRYLSVQVRLFYLDEDFNDGDHND